MIIKKLQEELDKNEEYKDLLLERKEILRSNGFINKLQPRFCLLYTLTLPTIYSV